MSSQGTARIGIGALSQATGIPANTLRTWERRYGFPVAERTEGGHRLYPSSVVEHLTLVQRALDRGHRPRQVLRLDLATLRKLLGETASQAPEGNTPPDEGDEDWMNAVEHLDAERLQHHFRTALMRFGLYGFLGSFVRPFLEEIGASWRTGRLGIYQEHFASVMLSAFLADRWRALSAELDGPSVVLATLPGEEHALGLHMVACVFALGGVKPIFVGTDVPTPEIVRCAERTGAQLVAISVSVAADSPRVRGDLEELARDLPSRVELLVGGDGSFPLEGATVITSLDQLARHLESR